MARATRVLLSLFFSALFSLNATNAAAGPTMGAVVDATGAAVVRAFVRVIDATGREQLATITDDRGHFVADLSSCNNCRIEASLAGFRTASVTVSPARIARNSSSEY